MHRRETDIYIHIYIYIYMYIKRGTNRHMPIYRETDRQTERKWTKERDRYMQTGRGDRQIQIHIHRKRGQRARQTQRHRGNLQHSFMDIPQETKGNGYPRDPLCFHSQSKRATAWTVNSVDESYFPNSSEWNNQSLFPSGWLLSPNTHFEICPYVLCSVRTQINPLHRGLMYEDKRPPF